METALQAVAKKPTLNNLIAALQVLQTEGHGNDLVEMSSDEEGNGYAFLNNIEAVNPGIVTFWPTHETH